MKINEEDLKQLHYLLNKYHKDKYGYEPNVISINEDGSITFKNEYYLYGDWKSETVTISLTDLYK